MPADYPFFFTWSAQGSARPVEVTGGSGVFFTTADGARWLDLGSLSYQANLGHGNEQIINAIKQQADSLAIALPSAVYPAKVELAQRLLALAPDGFTKVFFTNGGSEANENALKIARLVTGRYKLLSRYRSYHGATMGALSLTGDWRRPAVEPGIAGAIKAMDCYCDRCPFGQRPDSCATECATHIGDVLRLQGQGSVAAVLLEPVPGANGVLVPPADYWPMVRAACDADGALLIADEVLTGFGRTGSCFGFENFGATPDMITVAKGLSAGYGSLGAVLVHERVASHFDDKVLACGLTNYAHPLACAAGLAALKVYEKNDLYGRAGKLASTLIDPLYELQKELPGRVTAVRGIGLLAAIEVEASADEWTALAAALRKRHIFLHIYADRGTIVFAPPLIIDKACLEDGMNSFSDALREAVAGN